MGRWLNRLQAAEKYAERPIGGTDKADKTPSDEVSSVLSVRQRGKCEENSARLPATKAYSEVAASSQGITITTMPIEVSGREYDVHLDALIAASDGHEADRLSFAKRKGWVLPRGEDLIYVRGR